MLGLDRTVYAEIVTHARDGAPEEICGVLGGEHDDEASRGTTVRRTRNAAERPRTRYAIDPEEQFEAMRAIEGADDEVVGFYHSHPSGPPRPSETDAARATWPGYSYVIVVLSGRYPYVGSWRWTGETFEQEVVRLA